MDNSDNLWAKKFPKKEKVKDKFRRLLLETTTLSELRSYIRDRAFIDGKMNTNLTGIMVEPETLNHIKTLYGGVIGDTGRDIIRSILNEEPPTPYQKLEYYIESNTNKSKQELSDLMSNLDINLTKRIMRTPKFKQIFNELYPTSCSRKLVDMFKVCVHMDPLAHLSPIKRTIKEWNTLDLTPMDRVQFKQFYEKLLRPNTSLEPKYNLIYESERFLDKFMELYPNSTKIIESNQIKNIILSMDDNIVYKPKTVTDLSNIEMGNISEVMDWIEYLINNQRPDHWYLITKSNNKPVFKYILQFIEERNLDSLTEAIYQIKNNIEEKPKCICGKATKFEAYSRGYNTYCSFDCSTKDRENYRKRGIKIKSTLTSRIVGNGEYCYIDPRYDNMNSAHRRFKSSRTIAKMFTSLEEFDSKVPFYNWVPNTDFKQRLWYFESGLDEPRTCKICDSLTTSYTSNYCHEHHQMHDPYVKSAIIDTNVKKYGVQYPSQRIEHKEILRDCFPNRVGFVRSSRIADSIFLTALDRLKSVGVEFDKSDIFLNNYTKEYFISTPGKFFSYDFTIRSIKLIFEYNGEHVHPNTSMCPEDWANWKSAYGKESADVVYEKDMLKKQAAELQGFSVYEIWSSYEFDECVDFVVDKILSTL